MAQYKTKPSNTPDQFLRRQRMLEEQKKYGKYSSGLLLIFVCHYFDSSLVRVGFSFDVYYMLLYLFCKLITYDLLSASLHVDCTSTHNTASINLSTLHCFHLFYCHFLYCASKVMYISLMLTCLQI